jgi:hypothetical protein
VIQLQAKNCWPTPEDRKRQEILQMEHGFANTLISEFMASIIVKKYISDFSF